jgi:hypothetical protein
MRLLYSNLWNATASTCTALSAANALPATASQNPDRTYPWRSLTQTADQWVKIDAASGITPTSCAIANPRLQNAGSLKLQRSDDNAAWTDTGTFPAADADTRVTALFFSDGTHRYWRIYSTNGNPGVADYAETGYVHLGTYLEPTAKPQAPFDIRHTDPSVMRASEDGQVTFAARTRYAAGTIDCFMAQTDLDNLRTVYRTVGLRTPFFLVFDTSATWLHLLARFTGDWSKALRGTVSGGLHVVSIGWEEAR